MLLLIASMFFVDPAPLDMPRAEGYVVTRGSDVRLEDRFDKAELWLSQTVMGRWSDDEGRIFALARLATEPPAIDAGQTLTRVAYAAQCVPMKRIRANGKLPAAFVRAIRLLADTPLAEERPRRSRQLPHGYDEVDYWQHPTNYSAIVCAFRPEKTATWYLAYWQLAEADDYVARMEDFEDHFLRQEFMPFLKAFQAREIKLSPEEQLQERNLLRLDAGHSVAAYPTWRFTDSREFAVLDALPSKSFVTSWTNEFTALRRRYADVVPTPVDGSNVLSVARIYASRGDYLTALELEGYTNMAWTAAYWCPERRELVAHMPEAGETELLQTIRHEAFHQYLSYALAMVPASPWLNEGYAQYFEEQDGGSWKMNVDLSKDGVERLAGLLPGLLSMDYQQFYDGTDFERRLKYALAWSIAYFLEKGADRVRFRPFQNLKSVYVETLLRTQDMRKATENAFGEELPRFVSEWKKFWTNR